MAIHFLQAVQDATDMITVTEPSKLFNKLSAKFFIRLGIDLVTLFSLIIFVYYKNYKNREYYLTFVSFNLIIFLITYLLNKVELSMGAAFGLFAVFGIIRYRSEDISIKNITYLFIVIAIGMICAVAKGCWEELLVFNAIIIFIIYLLESGIIIKREAAKVVTYDNIEMIKPENHEAFLQDLKHRLGYNIHRYEVLKIDFLKDSAVIKVFYEE